MDIDYSKYARAIQESVQDKEVRDEPQQERQKNYQDYCNLSKWKVLEKVFPHLQN